MGVLALTAKFPLSPDEKQSAQMLDTIHSYLAACNFVSEYVYNTHDTKAISVQKAVYLDLRDKFGLPAQMACNVPREVVAKYKALISSKSDWVKVKFTKPAYDMNWNRDYSLKKDGVFSINTLNGRVKVPYNAKALEWTFAGNVHFGGATLVTKHGKWHLLVSLNMEVADFDSAKAAAVVGIDFGINFIATAYDGKKTTFYRGRHCKQKRAKFKQVRKSLQKRGTSSARRRLRKIGSRENRWMNDTNHCVSKALANAYPENTLFVIENLAGIRTATERVRRKDRYVQVIWSFYDLRSKLEYKTKRRGSMTIAVDPKYTSQRCPNCGHVARGNRNKKLHVFCCKSCGYQSNDDRVGGINLYRKGIEYLAAVQKTVA